MARTPAGNGKCIGYQTNMSSNCPAVGLVDDLQALVPANGATLSNLQVQLNADAAAGGNTVTVLDNGVATALTCTVPAGSKTCSNTGSSVTVAGGRFLTVKVSGSDNEFRVSFRY